MRFQKVKEVSNSINICWMFHSFIRTQHKLAHSKKVYYISIKYSIVYIYIYKDMYMHDEGSMTRSKKTQLEVSLQHDGRL